MAKKKPAIGRFFPKAHGNCRCTCHRATGVTHVEPCCIPSDEALLTIKNGRTVDLRAPWPFPTSVGTKEATNGK